MTLEGGSETNVNINRGIFVFGEGGDWRAFCSDV